MNHELTETLKTVVLTEVEWVTVLASLKLALPHYADSPTIRLSILLQLTKQAV